MIIIIIIIIGSSRLTQITHSDEHVDMKIVENKIFNILNINCDTEGVIKKIRFCLDSRNYTEPVTSRTHSRFFPHDHMMLSQF